MNYGMLLLIIGISGLFFILSFAFYQIFSQIEELQEIITETNNLLERRVSRIETGTFRLHYAPTNE